MDTSTISILAKIETLQEIQKTNPPTSERWLEASKQLEPLFVEMGRRIVSICTPSEDVTNTPSEDVIRAAKPSDYEAARCYEYVGTKAHGWNGQAVEQFLEDFCNFSSDIETLKDEYDLTYSQITDLLLLGHVS